MLKINVLLQVALAPTLICLFYIYIRDKYEKEPLRLLIIGVLFGVVISFPIICIENLMTLFAAEKGLTLDALYTSYIVAAVSEEGIKYIVLFFLVWKNKNFNERFDGIVYSVFISLGFAGLENILYVFNKELGGMNTALARAVFSVPGHAFFGVSMGYYFAIAKFEPNKKYRLIFYGFFMPCLLHGTYNFLLLVSQKLIMMLFVPLVIYMWLNGLKKIKNHINASPFIPD